MATLNTPSYNILVSKEKQIRAIQELYEGVNNIDALIPGSASTSNQLADKTWVTNQISGLGGMTISKVFPSSVADVENNIYYAFRSDISSAMTVLLPAVTDSTSEAVHIKLFFTLGTGASISYTGNRSSDPLYYTEGYALTEGNTYEVDICFNGKAWVIDAKKLVTV